MSIAHPTTPIPNFRPLRPPPLRCGPQCFSDFMSPTQNQYGDGYTDRRVHEVTNRVAYHATKKYLFQDAIRHPINITREAHK